MFLIGSAGYHLSSALHVKKCCPLLVSSVVGMPSSPSCLPVQHMIRRILCRQFLAVRYLLHMTFVFSLWKLAMALVPQSNGCRQSPLCILTFSATLPVSFIRSTCLRVLFMTHFRLLPSLSLLHNLLIKSRRLWNIRLRLCLQIHHHNTHRFCGHRLTSPLVKPSIMLVSLPFDWPQAPWLTLRTSLWMSWWRWSFTGATTPRMDSLLVAFRFFGGSFLMNTGTSSAWVVG